MLVSIFIWKRRRITYIHVYILLYIYLGTCDRSITFTVTIVMWLVSFFVPSSWYVASFPLGVTISHCSLFENNTTFTISFHFNIIDIILLIYIVFYPKMFSQKFAILIQLRTNQPRTMMNICCVKHIFILVSDKT